MSLSTYNFKGRVVLVAGGAGGIGRAVVRAFLDAEAIVYAVDVSAPGLLELEASCASDRLSVRDGDVSHEAVASATIDDVLHQRGRLDVLVNCVGGFLRQHVAPVEQLSLEDWQDVVDLNMTTTFLCTKYVVPHMKERQWGRIVNFSSTAGRSPMGGSVASYAAAKAGILGFTRYCAKELGPHGITVNAIAPGTIASPRVLKVKSQEDLAKIIAATPVRRLGTPEELAITVLFLATQEAGFITGATVDQNGGRLLL